MHIFSFLIVVNKFIDREKTIKIKCMIQNDLFAS